ncbi:DUF1799 domain-containing protein [Vibrio coralliilyticus]|nr:DUF1799 domain-containing protein [Vibrio coralliilyticus]NUW69154.1 DUF1799 domain-containing protein [Vibrio coralliilyticus]
MGGHVYRVWPENWPALVLFDRLSTQWRVGVSGLVGLDYPALYPLLDRVATDPAHWERLLEGVRAIEIGALDALAEADHDGS